jgi:hypothetical protein
MVAADPLSFIFSPDAVIAQVLRFGFVFDEWPRPSRPLPHVERFAERDRDVVVWYRLAPSEFSIAVPLRCRVGMPYTCNNLPIAPIYHRTLRNLQSRPFGSPRSLDN